MAFKGEFLIGLILMHAALIVAAIAMSDTKEETGNGASGKLNVITVTKEEIEGEYYDSQLGGIHFHVIVRDEYHFLSISTTEGEPLVISKQLHNSSMVMKISGTEFLVFKDRQSEGESYRYTDYIVPAAFHKSVEKSLKRDQFSEKLLRHLDSEAVNETRKSAIENLALRPEVELFMSASEALGDLGIIGATNPAAMAFYALTLRLEKYRDILLNVDFTEIENTSENFYTDDLELEYRQKRACGSRCPYGSCPYYGYGSNCFGMCGPRCSCQSWFCGDCCVHQGCRDHDSCCALHGYASWHCLRVWDIRCNQPFYC